MEQTSSCDGGHSDFWSLPQEPWSAIHARIWHGIVKEALPLADGLLQSMPAIVMDEAALEIC